MTTVDEIRIDSDGEIEVRVVPPDSVSQRPFLCATFRPRTPLWCLVRARHLRRISRELGLTSPIEYLVHRGGDEYTIGTADGSVCAVDTGARPEVGSALNALGRIVDILELAPSNSWSSGSFPGERPSLRLLINRPPARHRGTTVSYTRRPANWVAVQLNLVPEVGLAKPPRPRPPERLARTG